MPGRTSGRQGTVRGQFPPVPPIGLASRHTTANVWSTYGPRCEGVRFDLFHPVSVGAPNRRLVGWRNADRSGELCGEHLTSRPSVRTDEALVGSDGRSFTTTTNPERGARRKVNDGHHRSPRRSHLPLLSRSWHRRQLLRLVVGIVACFLPAL